MDPDPHGSEFIFHPRSGSRRGKKKCKEIGNNCKFIQFFKVPGISAQATLFLTFKQSSMFFKTKENSSYKVIFNKFKLDPDPHF